MHRVNVVWGTAMRRNRAAPLASAAAITGAAAIGSEEIGRERGRFPGAE